MSELNSPETLMASWKPRRPSARLERTLFGTGRSRAAGGHGLGVSARRAWGWCDLRRAVTAAASLAMAGFLVLAEHGWSRGDTPASGFPFLADLSNQSLTICLGVSDVYRNSPSWILGWTREDHFQSTNPSLDQLNTNVLLPKL